MILYKAILGVSDVLRTNPPKEDLLQQMLQDSILISIEGWYLGQSIGGKKKRRGRLYVYLPL